MPRVRDGGPKSSAGKARSSVNATKHGLLAERLLVGSERPEDWERNLRDWLTLTGPKTKAEGRMVVVLADLAFRLERCLYLEQQHAKRRLQERVEDSDMGKMHSRARRALIAVDALLASLEQASGAQPISEPALQSFLAAARGVAALVDEVDSVPVRVSDPFHRALKILLDAGECEITNAMFAGLKTAGEKVRSALFDMVRTTEFELRKVRDILADAALLADDAEAKKLNRYRDQLQKAMTQQIEIITSINGKSAGRGRRRSSFGKGVSATEAPIRLRVVR